MEKIVYIFEISSADKKAGRYRCNTEMYTSKKQCPHSTFAHYTSKKIVWIAYMNYRVQKICPNRIHRFYLKMKLIDLQCNKELKHIFYLKLRFQQQ